MLLILITSYFFGIIGSSLNVALSILLCSQSMSRTFAIFRICLHISAFHGFLLSQTVLLAKVSHIYCNGYYLHVLLWETMVISQRIRDAWYVFGTMLITATWQLTPAPCILQYLILSNGLTNRRSISAHSIIFISYAPSMVMMLFSAIWSVDFIPTAAFKEKLLDVSREFFDLPPNQTIFVYGMSFDPDPVNENRSLHSPNCLPVVLSYFVSYILFFCVLHRVKLLLTKSVMSGRTLKLQRRFIQLQLVQCLAPLLIIAVPLSIFLVGFILKVESIGAYSHIQTIGFYAMPTVQSIIHIYFVKNAAKGRRKQQNNAQQCGSNLLKSSSMPML